MRICPILLNLAPNEIPHAISQLLAKDINNIDDYYAELESRSAGKALPIPKVKTGVVKSELPKISEGDVVKIVEVEHLTSSDKAKVPVWVDDMDKYSGLLATVTGLTDYPDDTFVRLDIDDGDWGWSKEWLTVQNR